MTRMMKNLLKIMGWAMVTFPLLTLTVSAASWGISYALSLQANSINAQRAAFGYYQEVFSSYTAWMIPAVAVLTIGLSIRMAAIKKSHAPMCQAVAMQSE